MNNNRGNNRRRGRGNNRPQGGGQQLNRIDSRARGNAPQLLEKYRKLAQDAHLNGDRVTAEYYLQFADHYFRVIADTRVRQEEQRQRRDDRWQDQPEDGEEGGEFTVDADFPAFEQPVYTRREREDREPREPRAEREPRTEREPRDRDAPRRTERQPRAERAPREDTVVGVETAPEGGPAPSDEVARDIYEPAENPFVRPNRASRGLRPRRDDRRPRDEDGARDDSAGDDGAEPAASFDASVLPPSFAPRDEPVVADEAPAPKRRGRKPKVVAPVDGED